MMDEKQFARRCLALVLDSRTLAANWGLYLFDAKFDDELELRNKIGCIWLMGLQDAVVGEARSMDALRAYAEEKGFVNARIFLDRVQEYMEIIKRLLSGYSIDEQIFMQDMRDQFVHGWLSKRQQSKFPVKYFEDGQIKTLVVTSSEYREFLAPLLALGVDDVLADLVARFKTNNPDYWAALALFQDQRYLTEAAVAIYGDIGVVYPYTL
jgi:hypothetical protein